MRGSKTRLFGMYMRTTYCQIHKKLEIYSVNFKLKPYGLKKEYETCVDFRE
jgi:hypothetical protein